MTFDQELRKLALELAIACRGIAVDERNVLATAQKYYEFLTNKENSK